MPIDPKKLSAAAGSTKEPPTGKRFGLAARARAMQSSEEDEEDAEKLTPPDEEGEEDEPAHNPAKVIPFLEQYADEVLACCDEVDHDLLVDPDMELNDDNIAILQEGTLMLPARLQHYLPELRAIAYEDAALIASSLEEKGKIDDAETVAGWIFRIGQVLDMDEEEEGEDDEESEPED